MECCRNVKFLCPAWGFGLIRAALAWAAVPYARESVREAPGGPGGGKVNIGEVAGLAGVSRSTVSYVLSGKRQVTEATRQRVLRVIEEVGYRPSAVARSLRHGETRTLGLVIPPLRHRLSAEQLYFVGAVADAAADHDYDILLSPSGGDREAAFDKLVGERRVDGIVLMETGEHDDRARKLAARGFPFVTIGRTGSDAHAWVDLDFAGLRAEGARRLHELGHRRVALINRPQALFARGIGATACTGPPAAPIRAGTRRARNVGGPARALSATTSRPPPSEAGRRA